MSKRGTTYSTIPTLRHRGYGGPFDVIRWRPGERVCRRRSYRSLTHASAHRWLALAQGGPAQIIRDSGLEFLRDLSAGKVWKSVDECAG
jgi:hypothetical protein